MKSLIKFLDSHGITCNLNYVFIYISNIIYINGATTLENKLEQTLNLF